jgi:hypothetical protein
MVTSEPQVGLVHVTEQHELLHDESGRQPDDKLRIIGAKRSLCSPTLILEANFECALTSIVGIPRKMERRLWKRHKVGHITASHDVRSQDARAFKCRIPLPSLS